MVAITGDTPSSFVRMVRSFWRLVAAADAWASDA
jgi:hypothetical protein